MRYRYVIRCARMQREDAIEVEDFQDMLRVLEKYVERYGPIDLLLYNVGRV